MSTISDYVVQGGQSLTAGEVDAFRNHLAAYKLKAETLGVSGQGALGEQAAFLLRFIEDTLDGVYDPADFSAIPEAIFAIKYLAKGVDIIPDNMPGGYSDDAAVIAAVLSGHAAEFEAFGKKTQISVPFA
jgi:hypothetical protein